MRGIEPRFLESKSSVLTIGPHGNKFVSLDSFQYRIGVHIPGEGIEPPTTRLKGERSTKLS